MKCGSQVVKGGWLSHGEDFHAAVGQVFGPAGKAKLTGLLADKVAKSHALNDSGYIPAPGVDGGHVSFSLVTH